MSKPPNTQLLEKIIAAAGDKTKTLREIAAECHLNSKIIAQYLYNYNIEYATIKGSKKGPNALKKIPRLKEIIAQGETSGETLCKIIGTKSIRYLQEFCSQHNITLPKNITPYRRRPNIDTLIEQGLTLEEISQNNLLSRERIRQYINDSGQHDYFVQRRKTQKELESAAARDKTRRELITILQDRLYQKAKEQGWAYEKAVEYDLSRKQIRTTGPRKALPLARLITLFETYENAKKNNHRMSLQDLQNETELHFVTIGKIFRKMHIKPMYDTPHHLALENQERIKKAATLEVSCSDIAYFLGLPLYTINNCLAGLHLRQPRIGKRPSIFRVSHLEAQQSHLTYRLASQIYEAHDLGFDENDITNLFNTHIKITTYTLEQRSTLAPKIIRALHTLYPNHNINKPYLEK